MKVKEYQARYDAIRAQELGLRRTKSRKGVPVSGVIDAMESSCRRYEVVKSDGGYRVVCVVCGQTRTLCSTPDEEYAKKAMLKFVAADDAARG